MILKQIDTILCVDPGAPAPTILSNEYKLILLYYYEKEMDKDQLGYASPIERNIEDAGVASIKFTNHLIYKFGYPNVEALEGHPYYSYGLEPYTIFEVISSGWIAEIEQMNRVHPFHDSKKYQQYRHFIIVFNDSCFECIAESIELSFLKYLSMREALDQLIENFDNG